MRAEGSAGSVSRSLFPRQVYHAAYSGQGGKCQGAQVAPLKMMNGFYCETPTSNEHDLQSECQIFYVDPLTPASCYRTHCIAALLFRVNTCSAIPSAGLTSTWCRLFSWAWLARASVTRSLPYCSHAAVQTEKARYLNCGSQTVSQKA